MSAFRHRVHFYRDTSDDGELDAEYTSTFLANVPCDITDRRGTETYRGRQIQANTTHIIETRYYPGLLPNMMIENAATGDQYGIVSIIDHRGRQRFLTIEATEVVV